MKELNQKIVLEPSNVEQEVDDVAVVHDIFLALGAFCFAVNHAPNGGNLRYTLLRGSLAGNTLV